MKIYSIVRIGDEYVVRAGETSILKTASRRQAARLVSEAAELLGAQAAPQWSPEDLSEPSIAGDRGIIPDPSEVP